MVTGIRAGDQSTGKTMPAITAEELGRLLDYDQHTGKFTWKVARSNRIKVGTEAGSIDTYGHRQIEISSKPHAAHRLAFLYMTGAFPEKQVDHINGVRDDNRWVNLRQVSNADNCRNQRLRATNSSGVTGVAYDKSMGKWKASICCDYKVTTIGFYDTIEEAIIARKGAEKFYGFHENHGKLDSERKTYC